MNFPLIYIIIINKTIAAIIDFVTLEEFHMRKQFLDSDSDAYFTNLIERLQIEYNDDKKH